MNCVAQGFITAVSGCVEREVSESVGAGPGRGKRSVQLRRCWMMSALGEAKNGMRPGGMCPARAELRAVVRACSEPIIGDLYWVRCLTM